MANGQEVHNYTIPLAEGDNYDESEFWADIVSNLTKLKPVANNKRAQLTIQIQISDT